MKPNLCCILNYAPHYRKRIFQLLEEKANARFFVGNETFAKVKKMDYTALQQPVTELTFSRLPGGFYWLKGMVALAFKPYKNYILTGEPFCLSSWLVLILNRLQGKKTYLWTHGWYGREQGIRGRVKLAYFRLANGLLLYGERSKTMLTEMGFGADELVVVYNSLDYDQQIALRTVALAKNPYPESFTQNCPVLLFVGRLEKGKRVDLLLQAQEILAQRFERDTRIIIIGDGPDRAALETMAQHLGIADKVWFYGACYDETELASLIANADIAISPGYMGLTAMHALTYGTPVIAHKKWEEQMPEVEAISYPLTGSFFEKDNVDCLATEIDHWLKTYPRKTDELRAACYAVIDQKYNPHRQVSAMQSAFEAHS